MVLQENESTLKVVFLGLPQDMAENLGHIVSTSGVMLYIPQQVPDVQTLRLLHHSAPDLAFVWTGGSEGLLLIERVRMSNASVAVVAVNRSFKSSEVLDALDSGAMDYCVPPFDVTHIQRLLDTVAKPACRC